MKPRNKLQKLVLGYSTKLKPLTKYQEEQAILKIAPHIAKHNSKGEYLCMDCGRSWKGEPSERVVCPHCGAKLEVKKDRKRKYSYKRYFVTITTCKGFQVIREFQLLTYLYNNKKASHGIFELFQRWITPEGHSVIVSKARSMYYNWNGCWCLGSDMEIRQEHGIAHYTCPEGVVGQPRIIPILKRNGFDGKFYDWNPHYLLPKLITNNQVETLWKSGQHELAMWWSMRDYGAEHEYWTYAKLAMRHKYVVNDVPMWIDTIRFMQWCHQDTHNPKLILPENLLEAHDYWQNRYNREVEERNRRRIEDEVLSNQQREERYRKSKERFFDIELHSEDMTVKPLTSIVEFAKESDVMHHCVFRMKYYAKEDSLIMHAVSGNGDIIATIEYDLKQMRVVQCRGVCNSIPERKDEIINLIDNNRGQFMKRMAS